MTRSPGAELKAYPATDSGVGAESLQLVTLEQSARE
eukprot:CAMPEP_0180823804 /NCGR_PEP_ID=MMETSP1038_2-20121128/72098_1 /TAXON_ID=632150 /ORGANISM="Azadinium spinosum, Strain 3D9" /LENGTH=35 /DNA_ID= /DNA_START= /DNA_END= /DNA_ORIENTATION=